MGIFVSALLRTMPQLCLNGLDRFPTCRRLTRKRMPADRVVPQRTKPQFFLHIYQRPLVPIQPSRELPVFRK